MTEQPQPEDNLAEEFRSLGKNIVEVLRSAWEAPERKRLQQELEDGLNELGSTLRREAEHFSSSPAGQQFKSEVQDFGERLRSGEVETKTREEMLKAMQMANAELQKIIQQWSAGQDKQPPAEPAAPEAEKTE
jgi:hypothetical protein